MPRKAQRVKPGGQVSSIAPKDSLDQRFSQLYDEHFEFVWRTARYFGEPDASLDDAVQDVFVVAYRRLDDFDARSTPRTWLFGITVRVVSDHRRSHKRKRRLLDAWKRVLPRAVTTPYEHAVRSSDARSLLHALDTLGEELRATIVMADLADMTVPEIARAQGINLNTVYSRLRTARRELARQLERMRREDGA